MSSLTEEQKTELKKAFSVFDKDGNGSIDVTELGLLLANLGQAATDAEVKALMHLMDTDQSGTVDWSEFLTCMSDWLAGAADDGKRGKKRAASALTAREDLHKKISKFFLQFRTDTQFDDIRKKMSNWAYGNDADMDDVDDVVMVPGVTLKEYSDVEKAEYMEQFRSGNLEELANAVMTADNPDEATPIVETAVHLFRALIIYRTPMERREIGDDLIRLFNAFEGVIERLVYFLNYSFPQLQFSVCQIIALMAPGPMIASTPEDFYLHPSKTVLKAKIVDAGAVPLLIDLLSSPYNELSEQAMLALGSIAQKHAEFRDGIIASGALRPVVQMFAGALTGAGNTAFLRKGTWVLSVFCGVTHTTPPRWHTVRDCLPVLSELFVFFDVNYYDEETLVNVVRGLVFLLPGTREAHDDSICPRFVELMGHRSHRIRTCILANIVKLLVDDELTQRLFMANLLLALNELMQDDNDEIRMLATKAVSVIAGLRGRHGAMLEAGIYDTVVALIDRDPVTRTACVKILSRFTRAEPTQIRELVINGNIIAILCSALTFFIEADSVIQRAYNYDGRAFNFELVNHVFKGLTSILNAGDIEAEVSDDDTNPYAAFFDITALRSIAELLEKMQQCPTNELNAWRHNNPGQLNAEDRAKRLLIKVKAVADIHKGADQLASQLSTLIAQLLERYFDFDGGVSPGSANRILVKALCEGTVRILDFAKNVRVEDLISTLQTLYGENIDVAYRDNEGDAVSIATQADVTRAFEFFGASSVKIVITRNAAIPVSPSKPGANRAAAQAAQAAAAAAGGDSNTSTSAANGGGVAVPSLPGVGGGDGGFGFFSGSVDLKTKAKPDKRRLIEDLVTQTHYTAEQVTEMLESWTTQAGADGKLTQEQFAAGLRALGCTDEMVIRQNILAMDADGDGKLDFREYVVGLSTLQEGSAEDRLRLMFASYDRDKDGTLSKDEIYEIYRASLEARNEWRPASELQADVNALFEEVDENKDGVLQFDEFKAAVLAGKLNVNVTLHEVNAAT